MDVSHAPTIVFSVDDSVLLSLSLCSSSLCSSLYVCDLSGHSLNLLCASLAGLMATSSSPPDRPDNPYQQAMQDLTSFLHETSKNIERILHTFCTTTTTTTTTTAASSRNGEDSASLNSFTATRSLLPNIGENPSPTSESHLISFMEGIMKTSHIWSAQHKAILKGKSNVGIVETKPNELSKIYGDIDASIAETEEDKLGITTLKCNAKEASRMIAENEEEKLDIVTLDSNPKVASRSIKAEETCIDEDKREDNEGIAEGPSCVKRDESKSKKGSFQHDVGTGRDSNVDSFLTPTKNDTNGNGNDNNDHDDGDAEDDNDGGGGGGGGGGENSELPLTKWVPPPTSPSDMKIQSYRRSIEVISSPDWLPEGWITELKTRGSGNSAGTKDKYYVDPESKRRFRSRKEVLDFLETGKMNRHRKRLDTSPIRKFSEPESESSPPPTLAKQPIKRAKSKPNTMSTSSTPLGTSSGMMGNMYMPFRTGQPSEWLMYESLASLPFPMFDPFRYAEMNANKSSANKGPPPVSNRPWFFTGPEASWMPFSGLGRPGEKGREYQNPHSMPSSYAPESVTKKRVRKSSKKTAT